CEIKMNDSTTLATADQSERAIRSLLNDARLRLVETGTRNRLIHVNRASKRANCLNIINERSDDVFRLLRTEGRRMRFKAQGKDHKEADADLLLSAIAPDEGEFNAGRYTDRYL